MKKERIKELESKVNEELEKYNNIQSQFDGVSCIL